MATDLLNIAAKLIVIGGSAGSLDVLLRVLPGLLIGPATAVVVVVHRKNDTDSLLAGLLGSRSAYPVREVEDKEPILARNIYVAPSDYHLLIEHNHTFSLDDSEKVNYSRPSIDVTFETAAKAYESQVAGLLLSGANADGTEGLARIRRCGGLALVQDPASATMPFMPQYAIDHLAPDAILPASDIAAFLNTLQ